jgi:hypothetical protein
MKADQQKPPVEFHTIAQIAEFMGNHERTVPRPIFSPFWRPIGISRASAAVYQSQAMSTCYEVSGELNTSICPICYMVDIPNSRSCPRLSSRDRAGQGVSRKGRCRG